MNRTRIMNDARFISVVALCLLLVACSAEGDIPGAPQEDSYPIGFATTVEGPQSRGSLTTTNLCSMGVFAYYTGSSNWATSHKPNFMFNQIVTRTSSTTPWTYSPVKYWPNNPNDKISFFAYAPSGATGVSLVTTNTSSNYPILKYQIPFTATLQTDLLAATPLMNKTQSTTALSFQMKHVMTRVLVKAKCVQTITINRVQLNEAYQEAKLAFNATGTSWFEINSLINFTHSTPTTVTANTIKDVAEFFMIPATGKSITVNFTYNGTMETKTVALPTTPKWTEGTSIAYTLSIDKTNLEVTVAVWNDTTSDDKLGNVRTGDYYYTDGTVSPKLVTGKTPNGMVYWVDPTNPKKFKVMALDQSAYMWWSAKKTYVIGSGAWDRADGKGNSAAIKAYFDSNTSIVGSNFRTAFPAAGYCYNYTGKGGTDVPGTWHLPAKDELQYLWCAYNGAYPVLWDTEISTVVTANGTKQTAWNKLINAALNVPGVSSGTIIGDDLLWSSNEDSNKSENACRVSFSSGSQYPASGTSYAPKESEKKVRCVRNIN